MGDYDPAVHVGNYSAEMKLLLRQTDVIDARIQELHALPVAEGGVGGQQPAEAEAAFLKIACQLDTYGIDPHPVKISTVNKKKIIHLELSFIQTPLTNVHFCSIPECIERYRFWIIN